MKNYPVLICVLFCLTILVPASLTAQFSPEIVNAIEQRISNKRLSDTIIGALAFLEDRQVKPRPGKRSSEYDSSDQGDGCKTLMSINIPFKENIGLPAPKKIVAGNRSGEWASYIHFLPNKIGFKGRSPAAVQDSNLFMTAFIAYPMFLFDESGLDKNRRHVEKMLQLAIKNVMSFKRDDAYNFWAVLPGVRGKSVRTGPFNISVSQLEFLGRAYLNPKFERLFARLARGQQTPPKYWIEACLDENANPTGADALFNIPNDADDTSTAVAFQHFYSRFYPKSGVKPDIHALKRISDFRDLNRAREDGRDCWKQKNSGAFLTWIKDENASVFSNPEIGIIPLGVNNVDVVVNSNVVFAMAVTGRKDLPGYHEAVRLIFDAARKRAWPQAGLYYPQNMIFPYAASRAFRDGNAREPLMKKAMQLILRDLLKAQYHWGKKNPTRKGAFPGGDDKSDHLSTALAVTTLINIGRNVAQESGLLREYDYALRSGIKYLLEQAQWKKAKNPETRGKFNTPEDKCATWMSGLFFAASFWDLAHWRSQSFTVAMVLEALTKYALAYDLDDSPAGVRRLKLKN